jgi:protein-disulfide isomerase
VYLFSRGGSTTTSQTKVEDTLLTPPNSFKTAGISDGKYLPESKEASITLVEFGDYQCPACVLYHPLVKEVITIFSGKINFVFRNFPLPQHKNANISAYAAEAAGLQGKFWEMHDKIYENDKQWADLSDPSEIFIGYAKEFGLNTDKFKNDMNSSEVKSKVTSDTNDGTLIKVNSTPSFFKRNQNRKPRKCRRI